MDATVVVGLIIGVLAVFISLQVWAIMFIPIIFSSFLVIILLREPDVLYQDYDDDEDDPLADLMSQIPDHQPE